MTTQRSPFSPDELNRRLGTILDDAILDAHNLAYSLEALRDVWRELVVATIAERDGVAPSKSVYRRIEAQMGWDEDSQPMAEGDEVVVGGKRYVVGKTATSNDTDLVICPKCYTNQIRVDDLWCDECLTRFGFLRAQSRAMMRHSTKQALDKMEKKGTNDEG